MESQISDNVQETLQSLQNQIDNLPKTPSPATPAGPISSSVQLPNVPQGQGSNLNADMVDGINANTKPMPNCLVPLDSNGTFPPAAIPGSSGGTGFPYGVVTPTNKNVLIADGVLWNSVPVSGDVTVTANTGTVTLVNSGVTAATYGDSTHAAQVTVDAKGRITSATTNAFKLPGGSNTQVQFNDSGSFGGDSRFVWDKTNHRLTIGDATNLGYDFVVGSSTTNAYMTIDAAATAAWLFNNANNQKWQVGNDATTNTDGVANSFFWFGYSAGANAFSIRASDNRLHIYATSLFSGKATFASTTPIDFTGSGSTFNIAYETVSGMNGSNAMLSVTAANSSALKTYFTDTTGGSRLWVWDPTQSMPNLPSTGIKPTFAVYGDILIGDIWCIASNPMTLFGRVNTGLAATAVTQFFSAKNGMSDTDGGAQIVYAPQTGSSDSDGYISLVSNGKGSGVLANALEFKNRLSSGVAQQIWQSDSAGFKLKIGALSVSGAAPAVIVSTMNVDYSSGVGRLTAVGSAAYPAIQITSHNGTTGRVIATVDGTNQRLGILQGSPSYTLDVSGDVNTTGVYRVNGTAISLANIGGVVPIANGGTNSSTALSGSSIIVSNGTNIVQGAAGTTSTVLHGNASGAPTYGAVALASEVSGILPRANLAPVSAVLNIDAAAGTGCAANTTENTLKTYTLPAATLANDGDTLRITSTYRCASNTDTKRIRVYFGATVLIDSGVTAINGDVYTVTSYVSRTGATSQITYSSAVGGTVGASWITNIVGDTTFVGASETLSSTVVIKSTVQLGVINNANDVIQDQFVVEYLSAGTHS